MTGVATMADPQAESRQASGLPLVIGIDGGLRGGLAFLDGQGIFPVVLSIPILTVGKSKRVYDEQAIRKELWRTLPSSHAFIESAQAMPKQGVSSMFKIGECYGLMRGLLAGLCIPYEVVRPREWQREMFKGVDSSDTKKASILVAKRLFPGVSLRRTHKCRTDSDGMADALLIAEYGRRRLRCVAAVS